MEDEVRKFEESSVILRCAVQSGTNVDFSSKKAKQQWEQVLNAFLLHSEIMSALASELCTMVSLLLLLVGQEVWSSVLEISRGATGGGMETIT